MKLIYGVGTNDVDSLVYKEDVTSGKRVVVWRCPFYKKWVNMLERCYSEEYQNRRNTYKGCTVCEEWLKFSNFKVWMQTQDWEGKQLDKDLLFLGNKVYSPKTCVFITSKTNSFMLERTNGRGEYPIGVTFHKKYNYFTAQCCSVETGVQTYLGTFPTAQAAHEAWLSFKLKQAYIIAAEQADERIAKSIVGYYENYQSS